METINKHIEKLDENEQKRYRYEISRLDEAGKQQLETLVTRMDKAGAAKPLSWAWSEFKEGIPQWTRFMILKGLLQSAGDTAGNLDCGCDFDPAIHETYQEIANGAGEEKLKQFLQSYSKGMLYNVIGLFDEGNTDYDSNDSWQLMTLDREAGTLGKPISGLHEDFIEFENELHDNGR